MFIVKLGGSCITDKKKPFTPRLPVIHMLAKQLKGFDVIVTHGSGSFGHTTAKKYRTKEGFVNSKSVYGFAAVQDAASRLNRIVVSELLRQGIPAIAFQPSASLISGKGKIVHWDIDAIKEAMKKGIIPVLYGDVVVDRKKGCAIASTEELILFISKKLRVRRIVMCTDVDGVYAGGKVVGRITKKTYDAIKGHLGVAGGADVTGGMAQKVEKALKMAKNSEVLIINGRRNGNLRKALLGKKIGTIIR